MRILIVEDDYASRVFLNEILAEYGNCDLATNGIEAMEAYIEAIEENNPYSVIFLDIMIPKLDGILVLDKIRRIEKKKKIKNKVKIIMVSALGDKDTLEDAFNKGCDEYLTKPINIKDIKNIIKKL